MKYRKPDATCGDCQHQGCILNGDKQPWSKACGGFLPNRRFKEKSYEAIETKLNELEARLSKLEAK